MAFGYAVYFTEREKNRVVRWEPDTGSVDVVAGEPVNGDPRQMLNHPYGLAFDAGGYLLIADKINHRICQLRNGSLTPLVLSDPRGTRARLPDSPDRYDPKLLCPTALFMEPSGSFLCTFADDYTIYRIRRDLSLEHILGVPPNRKCFLSGHVEYVPPWKVSDTPINIPTGIVRRLDGTIFFIERVPQVVRTFHPDFGLRSLFPFAIPGEFTWPSEAPDSAPIGSYHPRYPGGLAVDQNDVLYLTEAIQSCVLQVDIDKGVVRKVIQVDRTPGTPEVGIAAIGFGPDGTAWILNTVDQAVEGYQPTPAGRWRNLGVRLTEVGGEDLQLPLAGSGITCGR